MPQYTLHFQSQIIHEIYSYSSSVIYDWWTGPSHPLGSPQLFVSKTEQKKTGEDLSNRRWKKNIWKVHFLKNALLLLLTKAAYEWGTWQHKHLMCSQIKGTVHPKMKILSSFTALISFQTFITFFLLNSINYILKNVLYIQWKLITRVQNTYI